eukprot:GAFH01000827.1.p1 GENE.GAFH01000827.1~~GAFH01000827.1.p1  ORF type:complete len:835 (-),score=291.05 GAFH01000827.1:219-2537(-)
MNRELLIRMIYCEMLGYDASFGHILAVNMTQQNTIPDKRVGYLACTVLLHENHELMIMITNSFRRDLRDKNYLVVAAALNTVSRLINNETIPVIMPLVVELLKHPTDLIRKKAIMVLHRIWLKSPDQLPNIGEHARAMLCDKDPSVMGAALCLLVDLCKQFPTRFKDLVPSFVSILKQITEHRLPKDFDYHRMPAPWLQMGLLRLIAILGQDDQHTSEGAYEVLGDVMRRADSGINIGHAVIYECVRTIATIYPCSSLLEQAATSISRFITSDNYNLKYLGITALAQIVQLDPKYIGSHQLEVLDCLEDNDETLKRKTLDLLFRISNPSNVQLVTDKLLGSLEQCGTVQMAEEDIYKSELITKITALAEKYAPTNVWYVDIINRVFLLGGDLVPAAVGDNMLQLITEGSGEDEQADAELRAHAVDAYMDMAREKPVLSDTLVTLMAWVLGEHGPALLDPQQIVETLVRLMDRDLKISTTRHAIVQALMKVCASMGRCPPAVLTLVEKYADSMDVELQQMCYEFRALAQAPAEIFAQVLPQGGSTEDLEVDLNLTFLNPFIERCLQEGARPYVPAPQRTADTMAMASPVPGLPPDAEGPEVADAAAFATGIVGDLTAPAAPESGLKFEAYDAPPEATAVSQSTVPTAIANPDQMSAQAPLKTVTTAVSSETLTAQPRKRKWGPAGYNDTLPQAVPAPATPTTTGSAPATRPPKAPPRPVRSSSRALQGRRLSKVWPCPRSSPQSTPLRLRPGSCLRRRRWHRCSSGAPPRRAP